MELTMECQLLLLMDTLCPLYYSLTTDNKDDDNDDDAPVASMGPQMYTINCQQSLCYVFMFVFLNSIIL